MIPEVFSGSVILESNTLTFSLSKHSFGGGAKDIWGLSVWKVVLSSQVVFVFVLCLLPPNCFLPSLRASDHSGLSHEHGRVANQWFVTALSHSMKDGHLPLGLQKKFCHPCWSHHLLPAQAGSPSLSGSLGKWPWEGHSENPTSQVLWGWLGWE